MILLPQTGAAFHSLCPGQGGGSIAPAPVALFLHSSRSTSGWFPSAPRFAGCAVFFD